MKASTSHNHLDLHGVLQRDSFAFCFEEQLSLKRQELNVIVLVAQFHLVIIEKYSNVCSPSSLTNEGDNAIAFVAHSYSVIMEAALVIQPHSANTEEDSSV
jgi:hypothetical protein